MAAKSKKAKTKEKPKSKPKASGTSFKKMLRDERLPKVFGLLCLLLSAFMAVAFISYLFTWKQDQSAVLQFSWDVVANSEVEVENALGRLGAIVSHQFFYFWFGLSSFLFVFLLFVTGFNLLLKKSSFPLKKIYRYSFFALVFIPVALGYIFYWNSFPFAGGYGLSVNEWLVAFLGRIGMGLLLVFSLLGFLVITFNIEFRLPNLKGIKGASLTPAGAGMPREAIDNDFEEEEEEELSKDIYEREEEEYKKEELLSNFTPVTPPPPKPKPAEKSEPAEGDIALDIEEGPEEEAVNENDFVNTNYDPTLDLPNYKYPTLDLLEDYGDNKINIDTAELEKNKDQIIETLNNYNIQISKINATVGPTVTLYEIIPAPGVRISKIKNLEDDIALSLAALGIRIIAPIPGKGTIGIEVPNLHKEIVSMRSLLASAKFMSAKMDLPIALGKNISNENYIADLAKMPHLLMAGATGQGKSVGLNAILISLLYRKHPSQLKFVLVDPKKVELTLFQSIEKHFLAKLPGEADAIITDTKKVVHTLNALCVEMDERYDLLKNAQVRNIREYNEKFVARRLNPEKGHRFLPFIVLVVDEFADLMMTAGKEVEQPIARLAQLARAIGIHLVIATQRPSVNIITGTIKANFPARMAFKVTSKVDSRTILDAGGADQLIGRGDMLLSVGGHTVRLQCAFVDTHEVEKVTEFIGEQQGYEEPFLLPDVPSDEDGGMDPMMDPSERDDMFEEAARVIVQHQQGSTSLIQRRLKLGYNRAGRIIDQLERAGIVGPHEGSKAREVLIKTEYDLEQFLKNMD